MYVGTNLNWKLLPDFYATTHIHLHWITFHSCPNRSSSFAFPPKLTDCCRHFFFLSQNVLPCVRTCVSLFRRQRLGGKFFLSSRGEERGQVERNLSRQRSVIAFYGGEIKLFTLSLLIGSNVEFSLINVDRSLMTSWLHVHCFFLSIAVFIFGAFEKLRVKTRGTFDECVEIRDQNVITIFLPLSHQRFSWTSLWI